MLGVYGVFTQLGIPLGCVANYAVALIMDKVGTTPVVFCRVMVSWGGVFNILLVILLFINFIP